MHHINANSHGLDQVQIEAIEARFHPLVTTGMANVRWADFPELNRLVLSVRKDSPGGPVRVERGTLVWAVETLARKSHSRHHLEREASARRTTPAALATEFSRVGIREATS